MDDRRPPIERMFELAVYAPVGVVLELRDHVPMQLRWLRQQRQAVANRVQLARFIGQIAVQQGQKELSKRLRPEPVEHEPVVVEPVMVEPIVKSVMVEPIVKSVMVEPIVKSVDAASLPIAEYESLAAIHVVERLGSLRPDELEAVRQFEQSHRARRTVLAKIAQLQVTA